MAGSTRLQPIGAPGDLIDGVEFDRDHPRQTGRKDGLRGGLVESVESGSPMDRAGIRPGDVLLSINGRKLRDAIDYQFFTADEEVMRLEVAPHGRPEDRRDLVCRRSPHELPGLTFTEPTFSPIRECNNHCPFCFIDQLPASMRSSLYIRDDDYRYSFLYGNFVTLTNLNERDWERLAEQRLSPLYVSVHATEPEMRRLLLGNDKAPDIIPLLERLFSLGIQVHTQVVTCPGLNDGDMLAQTVGQLAGYYPNVLSIGIVPVGLTRTPAEILSGPGASCSRLLPSAAELPLRTFEPDEARAVVRQIRTWQRVFRRRHGVSLAYASDEFYLLANEPVPSVSSYDGYPQFENGIGMVRDLVDDWIRLKRRLVTSGSGPAGDTPITLVCGEMIAETLGNLMEEWREVTGKRAELAVIKNSFFGPRVRVSGLLTGEDVITQAGRYQGDTVILPTVMLDKSGSRTLDGLTVPELEWRIGKRLCFASYLSEVEDITSFEPPASSFELQAASSTA